MKAKKIVSSVIVLIMILSGCSKEVPTKKSPLSAEVNTTNNQVLLQVIDWGPRTAEVGKNPNRQLDGGIGIWIKVSKTPEEKEINVYVGDKKATITTVDGPLITASIAPDILNASVSAEITVRMDVASVVVGKFEVK